MKNNYCVYMHKFPNGKVYIGQSVNAKQRWCNGHGYDQKEMVKAINEFGWENIEHIILKDNIDKKHISEEENKFIGLYKSFKEEFGYNKIYNNKHYFKINNKKEKRNNIRITISVDEEFKKMLEDAASGIGISPSTFIRMAVIEKMNRIQKGD